MKQVNLFFILLFLAIHSTAQNSYVYIEGIKGIPFNVISQEKEVVKLGKSYTILSFTEPGEKNIDITFVNSNFEKQKFTVDVQANSSYGFRLGKTEENKFYLIDIVNDGKVIQTNSPVNLALSTDKNRINFFKPTELKLELKKNEIDSVEDGHSDVSRKERRKNKKIEEENAKQVAVELAKDSVKVVEANISSDIKKQDTVITVAKNILPKEDEQKVIPAKTVRVSNCTRVAADEDVKGILDRMQSKDDDEAKLLLIKKTIVSGCFSSAQVYSMAELFETQYGRFSLAKFILPLTSDPSNLLMLEPLFKYEAYKTKLKRLVEN